MTSESNNQPTEGLEPAEGLGPAKALEPTNASKTPMSGGAGQVDSAVQRSNVRSGLFLGFVALVVLALAPVLYYGGSYLCQRLGIGVNPNQDGIIAAANAAEAAGKPATDRKVKVTFGAQVNDNLPVRFFPEERQQTVVVGEKVYNTYHFKNTSQETVRFRPIHSVSPPDANRVYAMTVCFCFNDQEIEPGGERSFEIEYILGEDLDRRVSSVQVNYSLHHITKEEMKPHVEGNSASKQEDGSSTVETEQPANPNSADAEPAS